MKSRTAFAKKDIVVLLGCAAIMLLNMGAVGSFGRKQAKEAVCLSNLRQWGHIFSAYRQANDGKFFTGATPQGYWWITQLEEQYIDWKANKIWFCPMATKPLSEHPRGWPIFSAWGIFDYLCPNGIAGSYGLNGYTINISLNSKFDRGVPAENGWRTFNVACAGDVPVFVDALRFDLWPLETDAPGMFEYSGAADSYMSMSRCCINRHDGAVNALFMDYSARKVGLKELWTLKWHRAFNTCGPWTKCGAVQPGDWPQWMREFKDY